MSSPKISLKKASFLDKSFQPQYFSYGFTLVEMLISVTIMLLMVGGGIAAFVTFNDKQIVLGAAKELQGHLRAAQQRAQFGDKPESGCNKLVSYSVRANQIAPVAIQTYAVCDNGEVLRSQPETLDSTINLSGALNISFRGLQGGVINPGTITLTSNTTGRSYSFSVTAGGEITEGAFN